MCFAAVFNSMKKTSVILICYGVSLLLLSCAATIKAGENRQSYYWYDGKEKKRIVLERERWVEFGGAHSREPSAQKKQWLEKRFGEIRVYRFPVHSGQSKSVSNFSAKQSAADDGTQYSELFKGRGGVKALPGGIIISFKTDWSEQKIKEWALQHNVRINKSLIKQLNLWLIDSPSGIKTLELANKITEQGEVNYATPNWWRAVGKK